MLKLASFSTGLAAVENVNSISERRSKVVRNRVFDCYFDNGNQKHFLGSFDPHSLNVKSNFDCCLSSVFYGVS